MRPNVATGWNPSVRRKDRIAPPLLPTWDRQTFLAWTRQHRPDVIVTKLPEVLSCLRREGFRVAEEIGAAFHSLDEKSTGLTGMRKNARQLGLMAVDLLIDMIHRGERGVAGNFFVIKACGAAAQEGRSLEQVAEVGKKVNSVVRSMGLALTGCTPPAKGKPIFERRTTRSKSTWASTANQAAAARGSSRLTPWWIICSKRFLLTCHSNRATKWV